MLSHLSKSERLGYGLAVALVLFVCGAFGAQYLRRTPSIEVLPAASGDTGALRSTAGAGITGSGSSADVVVDVTGAVKSPRVVTLPGGSRVIEAIEKAGGALPGADLEQINLAAKLEDGTQIFVPKKGGESPAESTVAEPYAGRGSTNNRYASKPSSTKPTTSTPQSQAKSAGGPVNINTADASELDRLPGVGPATAAKILEYRKAHGGFASVDELMAVKGIGPKKLEAMRNFVRLK